MNYLFIPFLLFIHMAFGEAMVVQLETELELYPIYISSTNTSYGKQLEEVLKFDFAHNGKTRLADQEAGSAYVIKPKVQNQQLKLEISETHSNTVKTIENISLTGDLKQDRKTIHQISDTIFKTLFGKEGIASSRILYVLKKQDPSSKKWISTLIEADYDGENGKQVAKGESSAITPIYIPQKKGFKSSHFLFVSYKTGQPKMYLGNVDDDQTYRLSMLKGNQLLPVMSRQRDKIAFISDVTGNPDLFLQDFHPEKGLMGKPRQIYAAPRATQGSPSFSPDGKQIAFVSNKDGSPQIYILTIPPQGAELKNIKAQLITKTNRENTAPAWSPDGSKIAFCAQTKGVRQIWVYDFTQNEERQLTQGPKNKENPAWASDSLHLIYNTADRGESDLYLMNLNQPGAVKITSGSGEKYFPSWESIGG